MTSQTNISISHPSNEMNLQSEVLPTNPTLTSTTLATISSTITQATTLAPSLIPIVPTATATPLTGACSVLSPKVTAALRPQTVILQSRPASSSPVRGVALNPATIRSASTVIIPAVNLQSKIITGLTPPVLNQKLSPKPEFITAAVAGPGVNSVPSKTPYIQISATGRSTVVAAATAVPLRPQLGQPQAAHQTQPHHLQQLQHQLQPLVQQVSSQSKHSIISPTKQTVYTISTNPVGGKTVITSLEQASSASAKKVHLKLDGVISATNRPGLAPISALPTGRVISGGSNKKKFVAEDTLKNKVPIGVTMQLPIQKSVLDLSQTGQFQQQQHQHQPLRQSFPIQIQPQPILPSISQISQSHAQTKPQNQQPQFASQQQSNVHEITSVNNESLPTKNLMENGTSPKKQHDKLLNEGHKNEGDGDDFGQKIVIIKKPRLRRSNIVIPGYPMHHFSKESEVKRVQNDKKTQLPEMLKDAQRLLTEKCKLTAFLDQIEQCVEQERLLQTSQKELLKFCEEIISPLSAKAAMSTLYIETLNDNEQKITALDRISMLLNDRIRSNIQRFEMDLDNLDESKKLLKPWTDEHKERIFQLCKMQASQEAKRGNRHSKC